MESIYLLDVEVEQNLSLLDSENPMPFFRYREFIRSQKTFAKDLKAGALFSFYIYLIKILTTQLVRKKEKKYFKLTLKEFFNI